MFLTKANAYGNDFLLIAESETREHGVLQEPGAAVRALCDRHRGAGADGVIFYTLGPQSATMRLFNADGSPSELSGNGLRCLAALVAREQQLAAGARVVCETDAGTKTLELLTVESARYTFRAAMGVPVDVRQVELQAAGETLTVSTLGIGNPQCVLLGPLPDGDRFNRLGPAISKHAAFPAGTNVEFVNVEAPDRVRIMIWERGVGPTTSSGTGACASAVAAAAHGGAARIVDVVAPGGSQRVEWREDSVYLTGWAEMVLQGKWIGA